MNGDGSDADGRAIDGDGGGDGGLLGAGGQPVGSVFDVAAGDDFACFQQYRSTHEEVTVGRVRIVCGGFRLQRKLGQFCGSDEGFHALLFEVRRWLCGTQALRLMR